MIAFISIYISWITFDLKLKGPSVILIRLLPNEIIVFDIISGKKDISIFDKSILRVRFILIEDKAKRFINVLFPSIIPFFKFSKNLSLFSIKLSSLI